MPLSYQEYAGDGLTTQYAFTFPYIKQAYVHAYVYDPTLKSRPEATDEVTFSWVNASTIELASPAAVGKTIRITRETERTNLVNFEGGSTLTEADLDKNATQLIHIAQEADDAVTDQVSDAEAARDASIAAQAAAEMAQSAAETAETNAEAAQTGAEAAEAKAEDWANEAEDVEVETGLYSAKHYAAKADAWANEAEDVEIETGKYSAYHHRSKAEDAQAAAEAALASAHLPIIQAGDADKALIVKDDESGYELGLALPTINAGDAGKHLAVNSGETGPEWVDPPSPINVRTAVLLGAVQVDSDAFIIPCGIAGTIVKVGARLRGGTSCAVAFKLNGSTSIGSVTATTTGAESTVSQACAALDYVQLDTGTLSGSPTDLTVYLWIQPS
ncbi:MAG: hypothetical protein KKE29_19925 [Proteobacteria bacterium]|nr:hypothetical protein [Pseudomonadota bacterium]MBU4574422.1 hypothetical protein [Pseudomonadota bacterium]MBV1715959.1 hypothetical protein [Desulfarculus sp.]